MTNKEFVKKYYPHAVIEKVQNSNYIVWENKLYYYRKALGIGKTSSKAWNNAKLEVGLNNLKSNE